MFQSHVYLEVRVLMPTEKKVFVKSPRLDIESAVAEKVEILAQALDCTLLTASNFEHLTGNISLPPEYDFSGYSLKVAENGFIEIEFHHRKKRIRIEEIRIEEDGGRLTHSDNQTRMDYTWAGCASVRLRTAADFELGEEAVIFLDELARRIQYLQLIDYPSQDSFIRCNAYTALARYPAIPNYYVKLRNLNSFNFVRKAINAELNRQEEILSSGGIVPSESRLWNERQNRTDFYQERSVELDRFEPLVPPAVYRPQTNDRKKSENAGLRVELPEERRRRFCQQYGLSKPQSEFLCDEKNRADYFESLVALGVDPLDGAHWLSSELLKHLRRTGHTISSSPLNPQRFAAIMTLFTNHKIHSGIAKQLFASVMETNREPEQILAERGWWQISSEAALLPLIKKALEENPGKTEKLRQGEMGLLEFFTGIVMKKTEGLADPQTVKQLIKKELKISLVYVLSMGGSICGYKQTDGAVSASDDHVLQTLLPDIGPETGIQLVSVRRLLSEEIEPADWAVLIAEISECMASGLATGIVVAHGTDTLSYTAPLLYWLFSDSEVPLVITASSATPDMSNEARDNLSLAIRTACEKKQGVYVAFGGKLLSPLNLKFEEATPTGFSNWNMAQPIFTGSGPLSGQFTGYMDADSVVMRHVLQEAADKVFVCKVYPGLQSGHCISLIERGVKYFFLELYETGTGSMRSSDYSLKQLLIRGRKKGCQFYCTSQQQSLLDFSGYTTSRRVWREGAVPMGSLTTESAVALYFAASLVADNAEELQQCMEAYSSLFA